jgi:hypothetical protein
LSIEEVTMLYLAEHVVSVARANVANFLELW